jgi:hypothetical protein
VVAKRGRDGSAGQGQGSAVPKHIAMNWAQRLKRVFGIEIKSCERCGGAVKIIASIITDSAIRDLIAISDYIRPHNPDRAATFVDELLDQCEALAEFPQRYALVPRYEHHGIRRCVHAN